MENMNPEETTLDRKSIFLHPEILSQIDTNEYPLRIQCSREKGLHMVASRPIACGEVVLRECPVAMALEDEHSKRHCGFCALRLTPQDIKLWKQHKIKRVNNGAPNAEVHARESILCEECLSNNYIVDLNDMFALLGIRLAALNNDPHPVQNTDTGLYRIFFRMMFDYGGARRNQLDDDVVNLDVRHVNWLAYDRLGVPDDLARDIDCISSSIREIYSSVSPNGGAPSVEEISSLCKKLVCNQHAILGEKNEDIGRALFPLAALFNHGCRPNVSWDASYRNGCIMECKALSDIAEGQELLISYMDPVYLQSLDAAERRQYLYKHRHFLCACELCREHCNHCGKSDSKAMCGKCRQVWYCGADCQRIDWKQHKLLCTVLRHCNHE